MASASFLSRCCSRLSPVSVSSTSLFGLHQRRFQSDLVRRARLQEKIMNDEDVCRRSLRSGRFMLMHKGQPLMSKRSRDLAWADFGRASALTPELEQEFAFLGLDPGEYPLFAVPIDDGEAALSQDEEDLRFLPLRMVIFTLNNDASLPLVTRAWSLLQWHRKSSYCPNCGGRSKRNFSGSHRFCVGKGEEEADGCGETRYPHTSPVGIALPAAKDGSGVVLIRQSAYPPGMYSCVAGFVDVGESLEECVRREVAEEAGLEVGQILFRRSQHWPFPSGSLMMGCEAVVAPDSSGNLRPDPLVDGNEIEEARWFNPEELRKAFDNSVKNPRLRFDGDNSPENRFVPPRQAVAHHLVKAWLQDNGHLERD